MNNIFTFDADDDQQLYEQQSQSKVQTQELKTCENRAVNNTLITFDDFDEFQEQQHKEQNVKDMPKQYVMKEVCANVEQTKSVGKMELEKNRERRKQKQKMQDHWVSQNQTQPQPHSTKTQKLKKQQITSVMPGLEVQDLGTKEMQYVSQKKALKVTDLRKFLCTPLGDYKVKALIRKEGGNLFSLSNKFNVYIEQNNRYLFTISRQGISQYVFSLDKNNISEKKKSYLGKMISNMAGTQFLVFDNGFSPKETRELESCRKQLASIKYSSSSGPRKFTSIVSTNCQGFYALEADQNILQQKWQKKQRDFLSILYSKAPELDPEDGNYKLDFKGIVKKASVKNFILGGVEWQDSLIFGKIDNNTFVMEIKEPLSVLQAAAISISSIHYKLNWR